jgi:molybdate transport system substrate-binding protein
MRLRNAVMAMLAGMLMSGGASAAELKVLTTGAMKPVVLALLPQFESQGHKLIVENDTAGALTKRIENGDGYDVAVITPAAIDGLIAKGKAAPGSRTNVARVGVGVMVKDGAPKPDIATVDAFKQMLLTAKSIAHIDPQSGGSTGIYLTGLFEKLGMTEVLKPKTKLKFGGLVADLIVNGDAEIGLQSISEIILAKGVTFVGPLPADIQNYTVYAAGISPTTKEPDAAKALIGLLASPAAANVLREKGLERPS